MTRIDTDSPGRTTKPLNGKANEVGISGRLAIVTIPTLDRLLVFDARTMKRKGPAVDVAGYPFGIADRGHRVYVTASDDHELVELER